MAGAVNEDVVMEDEGFFFPSDIMINILKRLPVKSLLRFRCVCKDWNDLFRASSFIKEQLHHSSHHRGPSLLLQLHLYSHDMEFELLDSAGKTLIPLDPPPIYLVPFVEVRIIGSSYGVVCLLQLQFDSLFLWNPATREARHVPKSINNVNSDLCHIGFGFSRALNDYKIVRIYDFRFSPKKRVEVYSLSTGSWKEVEFGDFGFIHLEGTGIVTGEAMCWLAYKMDGGAFDKSIFVVSFDMVNEVFTVIQGPVPSFSVGRKLVAYENKLALLSDVELCVMEGTTSEGSVQRWNNSTKFIGSFDSSRLYPRTIWGNQAVFQHLLNLDLSTQPDYAISLFNLTANKEFISIALDDSDVQGAFNYVESLVSIGHNN